MAGRRRVSASISCSKCVHCTQAYLERATKRSLPKHKKAKSKRPVTTTTTTEAALRSKGSKGDVYEDMMLYVRDQPVATRGRGRPRKFLPEVTNPLNKSTEVIYVPSVKKRAQFIPVGLKDGRCKPIPVQAATNYVVSSVKCVGPSQPAVPSHSLHSLSGAKLKPEQQIDWPDDLQWLVDSWDKLPERQLRETVKWLMAPPKANVPLPDMVSKIHKNINEWDETIENKIEQIGSWLLETPPTPTPPKVVVQAEPEHNGQWSSLQDQKPH